MDWSTRIIVWIKMYWDWLLYGLILIDRWIQALELLQVFPIPKIVIIIYHWKGSMKHTTFQFISSQEQWIAGTNALISSSAQRSKDQSPINLVWSSVFRELIGELTYHIIPGWWFGCHEFYFPIYWVANHPNWRSYFSGGWPNHQPDTDILKILLQNVAWTMAIDHP